MHSFNTLLMMVALEFPPKVAADMKAKSFSNTQQGIGELCHDKVMTMCHELALSKLDSPGALRNETIFKNSVDSALNMSLTDYIIQVHQNIASIEIMLRMDGIRLLGKQSKNYTFQPISVL